MPECIGAQRCVVQGMSTVIYGVYDLCVEPLRAYMMDCTGKVVAALSRGGLLIITTVSFVVYYRSGMVNGYVYCQPFSLVSHTYFISSIHPAWLHSAWSVILVWDATSP